MHQFPRAPPPSASPANSLRTNPARTNNPRDRSGGHSRQNSVDSTPPDYSPRLEEGTEAMARGHAQENLKKLSQVVQNYYTKASLIILHSRVTLPPAYTRKEKTKRINRWFNVELDETELLDNDLRVYRASDAVTNRPPPMIIEVYINMDELTNNQSLVIIDDNGKRWDVEESIRNHIEDVSTGKPRSSRPQIVLERWRVDLGKAPAELPGDLGAILPKVYKNSIVLFRSLFTYAKLLPAWKLSKRFSKPRGMPNAPKLKFRILNSNDDTSLGFDELRMPLCEGQGPTTEDYSFGQIESPAGQFNVSVTYRSNCDFRVDNSEALLSSHFMGLDEDMFEPSLGHNAGLGLGIVQKDSTQRRLEIGSLPQARKDLAEIAEQGQAYGSLSTFHAAGARVSSSPLTALRTARELSDAESPGEYAPQKNPPDHRLAQGSRSSLRSNETPPPNVRRPSVSFMPFKSPSLSSSPMPGEPFAPPMARTASVRTSALGALTEVRSPVGIAPAASSLGKGSPIAPESGSSQARGESPRPAAVPRYSSSFSHRRGRLSVGGTSVKTDDDNNSSGKASLTSSNNQPVEGGNASSGSVQTDDDNISDFLKMLDQKKTLKSFEGSAQRSTSTALSKFQQMRDSNAQLSESMTSSVLHRSSSSSSRQLANVPPMVPGASTSIASSPGERVSPRTPHTPAIPSRLSANSIIEYNQRERAPGRNRPSETDEASLDEAAEAIPQEAAGIPIPTSPRPFAANFRRPNSMASENRPSAFEDDIGDALPFSLRSASPGREAREPHDITALHSQSGAADVGIGASGEGTEMSRQRSTSSTDQEPRAGPSLTEPQGMVSRFRRNLGRGSTPPYGSVGSSSSEASARGGRSSFGRPPSTGEDDEPLLFTMSDFGQGRRSVEEGRGGGSAGAAGQNPQAGAGRRGGWS